MRYLRLDERLQLDGDTLSAMHPLANTAIEKTCRSVRVDACCVMRSAIDPRVTKTKTMRAIGPRHSIPLEVALVVTGALAREVQK